jgi:hypothetical protein
MLNSIEAMKDTGGELTIKTKRICRPSGLSHIGSSRISRLDLPLLKELASICSAGIQVFLATNQEHMRAAHLMQNLGLAKYVDGIHYSAQLGLNKPSRDFFTRISSHTGFVAAELLLIDDTLDNVNAAAEAGWKIVHWTRCSSPGAIRAALREQGLYSARRLFQSWIARPPRVSPLKTPVEIDERRIGVRSKNRKSFGVRFLELYFEAVIDGRSPVRYRGRHAVELWVRA